MVMLLCVVTMVSTSSMCIVETVPICGGRAANIASNGSCKNENDNDYEQPECFSSQTTYCSRLLL